MRLDKLDIVGFKSFADKTTIRFGHGVTGVVGPNGCGKSNIVDAIRWVMGEMSARTLRGGSMQDVIFNGSEKRAPLGMAEVCLTFENDGKGVPPEYQSYSEIQVTRRLFRDGDSEYEINKTPCRLKDVHELFLGTGVGSKAYSIIQQGQVSDIMRVKPEDRRRIIEEAAGITKYKARKDAAVRKMDATRQNLQRIDDVTREIGRRLGSLKRQAKKAEKFKELRAVVREIELHRASFTFLELSNAVAFDRELYQTLTESVQGDVDRVARLEDDIEAKRGALSGDERALSEMQARLYEVDNGLALNEQTAEHARREHERSKQRDAEAAVDVERLKEQQVLLDAALAELKKGSHQLELEFTSDERDLEGAVADLEAHRARRADETAKVDGLRGEMIARSTDAAKAAADVHHLKGQLPALHERREQLAAERAPLVEEEAQLATAAAQTDAERVRLDQEKTAAELERAEGARALQTLRADLEGKRKELQRRADELHKKKARLHSLEEIHARYEQSPEAVRALLKRGGPLEGKGKLLVDLFEAPSDLELPIEAALGARLQAVVVQDESAAAAALDHLAADAKAKGRAELIVESAIDAAASAVRPALAGASCVLDAVTLAATPGSGEGKSGAAAVLSRVFLVDERASASALWQTARAAGVTLVTRAGEVYEPTGTVRGGAASGADSGVLRQKREMRELVEDVKTLDVELAERESEIARLTASATELDESLREVGDRIQTQLLRLVEVRAAHKRHQEELARLEQRGARLKAEEDRAIEQLATAEGDLASRQARLVEAESARAAIDAELHQRGQALLTLEQQIAIKQESVTTMRVRAASIAERREMLSKNLEASEKQAVDLTDRLHRLQRQIENGHGEREQLMKDEADARGQLAVLGEERLALKARLDEARVAFEKHNESVRVMEHEARAARAALDATRSSHADLQVRIRERELELDAVIDRCIEHHRTTPQEALFDYHMREPPPADAEEQLQGLEKQIEALGAINLTAIDECADLEKRHDFLRTQADDLTHALNQLEKAIVKINRTTKKRFQETFDGVNERFQQVFPRLFRGGKAWLALTDPNDLLATGVEIYAQPPGKKLGSITMMSGGEQALTAVSLIFAIFLLKPSPFCVLDEVDAPLDEANVGRFNDMVRDVASLSQFIVITHNKRTMEVVDQLYGVTMEEAGISKTVNVRIQ
ncbi:MAG: chromosome segregation protein SMC [Deltaproteobacteria bacterium]|nr:chromosome segregation protein SMC [Deltaproteobacteria bacterium]